MAKTPEEVAREAAEEAVTVRGEYAGAHIHLNGVDLDWAKASDIRSALRGIIAAAIRAHAAQSPVAGSPLSDERLGNITRRSEARRKYLDGGLVDANDLEPGMYSGRKGAVYDDREALLAHIDFLHAIMSDDIDARAQQLAYEKGRRDGFAAGAQAQREAGVKHLRDVGYLASTADLAKSPLVTEAPLDAPHTIPTESPPLTETRP